METLVVFIILIVLILAYSFAQNLDSNKKIPDLVKRCNEGDAEACISLASEVSYMDALKYLEIAVRLGSAKAARKLLFCRLVLLKELSI
jgi:hypothetical protein